MRRVFKNQQGLTLIEVLGTVMILGVAMTLSVSVIFSIFKTTYHQRQKVEMQQVSNGIVAEIERINQIDNIYSEAGYRGKFINQQNWAQNNVVKILKQVGNSNQLESLPVSEAGENAIWITDINDTLNQKATLFKITDSKIKIKILQQKNENSVGKTIYSMQDYRENYSVQTTAMILFYKETLNFATYYNTDTGLWDLARIKQQPNVVYSRLVTSYYRDKDQERGEVPGDGR